MRGYFLQNAEKVSENLTFFPDMGIWTKRPMEKQKNSEKFQDNFSGKAGFLRKV
jgi:hypothetical protein